MAKKVDNKKLSEKVSSHKLEKEPIPASEMKERPDQAQYKGRAGWGGMDTYAYAVGNVLNDARQQKLSDKAFLGKDKQILDPKQQVRSDKLYDGAKKKK